MRHARCGGRGGAPRACFDERSGASPSISSKKTIAPRRADGGGGGGVGARVLSQLLHEMDGIQPLRAVLVVAATNRPDLIDAALLRPGRFDRLIHVGLPDETGRAQILAIHTRAMPLAPDVSLGELAAETAGYSGAELAAEMLTRFDVPVVDRFFGLEIRGMRVPE